MEAYFGIRIAPGDESDYADAHARLDALLPGDGSLTERYAAYRALDDCPPDRLSGVVHELSGALREVVRSGYGLPEDETVDYLIVTDEPWSGFNYYLGGMRSRVAINADLPHRLSQLPHLVAHESYPGHHTEHCRKERGLVAGEGRLEHTVFLVNTPECLVAEGLADLGIAATIGSGWGPWAQELYADLRLVFDGARAEQIAAAVRGLDRARQDAALLLHDRGAVGGRRGRLPDPMDAGAGGAGAAVAALPVPSAVAGVHVDVRGGLPAAVGLAGRAAGRGAGRVAVRAAAGRAAHPRPPHRRPPPAHARRPPRVTDSGRG